MGDNDPIDACEIGTMVSVILSQLFCSLLYIPFYSCVLDCQTFEQDETNGDLVLIQMLLLFKCKLLCYHAF